MKQLMAWAKEYFAKYHHFDTTLKPIWKGECLEPVIFRELTSGIFQPAKGNALLVGDAGGLLIPFSREGVGVAVKTGLLAANSIRKAIDSGESASAIYLTEISGMISAYKEIYPWVRRMIDEARSGGHSLPRLLRDTYGSTIRMF
jgi:flavin-dependent dehydrogenase